MNDFEGLARRIVVAVAAALVVGFISVGIVIGMVL